MLTRVRFELAPSGYRFAQGRINAHLTGGVQISLRGVHWCATKGADRAVVFFLGFVRLLPLFSVSIQPFCTPKLDLRP